MPILTLNTIHTEFKSYSEYSYHRFIHRLVKKKKNWSKMLCYVCVGHRNIREFSDPFRILLTFISFIDGDLARYIKLLSILIIREPRRGKYYLRSLRLSMTPDTSRYLHYVFSKIFPYNTLFLYNAHLFFFYLVFNCLVGLRHITLSYSLPLLPSLASRFSSTLVLTSASFFSCEIYEFLGLPVISVLLWFLRLLCGAVLPHDIMVYHFLSSFLYCSYIILYFSNLR